MQSCSPYLAGHPILPFTTISNSTSASQHHHSNTPILSQHSSSIQQTISPTTSLPSAASSSVSSPTSCSSFCSSSLSDSSSFSPSSSSSSSSPPLYRHPHPLEPDIALISSHSSPVLSPSLPAANIIPSTSTSKSSRPLFLLPGPKIHPFHLPPNPQSLKVLNPPPNFATVAPGVFRSSFPKFENLEFLAMLQLKTILTLVQEPYPLELVKHYERVGIKLIQYPIPGNKEPFVHIPEDKIRLALRQVLDIRNQPMLIHCNKGKHRTGCLVGCLRKLQHWSSTAIFDEYRRYAFPKSRSMDQQFIELFDHSAVWEEVDPEFAPEWLDLTM